MDLATRKYLRFVLSLSVQEIVLEIFHQIVLGTTVETQFRCPGPPVGLAEVSLRLLYH
jgi:hypothetical protein